MVEERDTDIAKLKEELAIEQRKSGGLQVQIDALHRGDAKDKRLSSEGRKLVKSFIEPAAELMKEKMVQLDSWEHDLSKAQTHLEVDANSLQFRFQKLQTDVKTLKQENANIRNLYDGLMAENETIKEKFKRVEDGSYYDKYPLHKLPPIVQELRVSF